MRDTLEQLVSKADWIEERASELEAGWHYVIESLEHCDAMRLRALRLALREVTR